MDSPREETQARPWKCPDSGCKYHKDGWATEKELSRHVNDKHKLTPPIYRCQFPPCPYKSKREFNCKQHMEKSHGWEYGRSKTSGRRDSAGSIRGFNQASGNRIARTMTDAPSDAPANTNLFGSYLSSDGWSESDSFLDFDDHLRNLEPDEFSLLPRPTDAGDGPPPDDRPEAMSIAPVLNTGAAPPSLPPPRQVPPVPSSVNEPMQGSEGVDTNEEALFKQIGEAMGIPIGDDITLASAGAESPRPRQN
ncbi:hypothetical protein ACHAPW_005274 [Verticillium nonalfalfae]